MMNSMYEYAEKDPSYYVGEVRFRRSNYHGAFIIVEGFSDLKFYSQVVLEDGIVVASNKSMAIGILEILNKDGFLGVVAIVDKDCDELRAILPQADNLFFTDSHDLETLLIQSPALEKVLGELGSKEKINKLGRDVRDILLDAGSTIGYLRWISIQDALHLKFTTIQYNKFLDKKSLTFDESNLMEEVRNKYQPHVPEIDDLKKQVNDVPKIDDLKKRVNELKNSNHDRWQVCRGHDLVQIMSFGLTYAIGTRDRADVKPEILERSLRLAYQSSYFSQTKLYSDLEDWQH
jgi:hypothetical protein